MYRLVKQFLFQEKGKRPPAVELHPEIAFLHRIAQSEDIPVKSFADRQVFYLYDYAEIAVFHKSGYFPNILTDNRPLKTEKSKLKNGFIAIFSDIVFPDHESDFHRVRPIRSPEARHCGKCTDDRPGTGRDFISSASGRPGMRIRRPVRPSGRRGGPDRTGSAPIFPAISSPRDPGSVHRH